jgi:hypothetical protein
MKICSNKYPLLTPDDILTLRGQPSVKVIESESKNLDASIEEWTYYHNDIKELYLFKKSRLIGYQATK